MSTEYIYNGEKFIVTKPEACKMHVSAKGLTANIYIHTRTNQYREDLHGWGSDHPTLQKALASACRRILRNAAKPSAEQLCKGMDEFYASLSKQ